MPADRYLKARLMAMMFLQFFIWGAWYATGGNYMKATGMTDSIYLAYMASPIGSIVTTMFLAGFREEPPAANTAVAFH